MEKEKEDLLKEVGAVKFKRPMEYCIRNLVFSEAWVNETPIDKLRERLTMGARSAKKNWKELN